MSPKPRREKEGNEELEGNNSCCIPGDRIQGPLSPPLTRDLNALRRCSQKREKGEEEGKNPVPSFGKRKNHYDYSTVAQRIPRRKGKKNPKKIQCPKRRIFSFLLHPKKGEENGSPSRAEATSHTQCLFLSRGGGGM